MKQTIFAILFILGVTNLYAQKNPIYLLNDFTQGTVLMKNGSKAVTLLNYDACNRLMKYKEKDDIMILTNTQQVDTIFIASHKFIPANRFFLEVIDMPNGKAYINWLLKETYKGKVGAYGQTTQSTTSTTINTSYYNKGIYKNENKDVIDTYNDNDYWFFLNNKLVKFKNEKSLLKLFPQKEEAIRNYIKKYKTDMKKPEQIIELMNYCLE